MMLNQISGAGEVPLSRIDSGNESVLTAEDAFTILANGLQRASVARTEAESMQTRATLMVTEAEEVEAQHEELEPQLKAVNGALREIARFEAQKVAAEQDIDKCNTDLKGADLGKEQWRNEIRDINSRHKALSVGDEFWVSSDGQKHQVTAEDVHEFIEDCQLPEGFQRKSTAEIKRLEGLLEDLDASYEPLYLQRAEARESQRVANARLVPLLETRRQLLSQLSEIIAEIKKWEKLAEALPDGSSKEKPADDTLDGEADDTGIIEEDGVVVYSPTAVEPSSSPANIPPPRVSYRTIGMSAVLSSTPLSQSTSTIVLPFGTRDEVSTELVPAYGIKVDKLVLRPTWRQPGLARGEGERA